MYTVALNDDLTTIPSTHVRVSSRSKAYVDGEHCNLAFISHNSQLYQQLSGAHIFSRSKPVNHIVKHGFWSLIPVMLTEYVEDKRHILQLLPKLSPGQFFGAHTTRAIYCDPDVIFDSVPRLLEEASMQPKHDTIQGATAMLIGKRQQPALCSGTRDVTQPNDLVQDLAYRTIRIAVIEEMIGDGFSQLVDSSFVVHLLNDDDSRLFRCDVFGEVIQWDVTTDTAAFEFIMGLHDMWSRVMVKRSGVDPWWIGEDASTVAMPGTTDTSRRRLREAKNGDHTHRGLREVDGETKGEESGEEDEDSEENPAAEEQPAGEQEHDGFGGVQEAIRSVFGGGRTMERLDRPEEEEADDFVVDDDDVEKMEERPMMPLKPQDPSSYDVWMGILSSTGTRYFSRIVTMEAVGAYRVGDYEESF
jgi:hypothetical protein